MLSNLAPWLVSILLELPELLDPDQPDAVKERLYPEPSADPDQSDEWRKFVHPDLFALLASAREIVAQDLATLCPTDEEAPIGAWELRMPAAHVHAWISALNAARLTLAQTHEVDENDMNEDELEPEGWDEKRLVVAKIHLLGWIQQMIIEDTNPPPPPDTLEVPDSLPPDVE